MVVDRKHHARRVSGEVFRAVFNKGRPTGDASLRSTLCHIAAIP